MPRYTSSLSRNLASEFHVMLFRRTHSPGDDISRDISTNQNWNSFPVRHIESHRIIFSYQHIFIQFCCILYNGACKCRRDKLLLTYYGDYNSRIDNIYYIRREILFIHIVFLFLWKTSNLYLCTTEKSKNINCVSTISYTFDTISFITSSLSTDCTSFGVFRRFVTSFWEEQTRVSGKNRHCNLTRDVYRWSGDAISDTGTHP